jgi:hypothetical protein
MTEFIAKVEALPGIKLTPGMVLAEVLGNAEDLETVIIITRDKSGELGICFSAAGVSDLSAASMLCSYEAHSKIAEQNDDE